MSEDGKVDPRVQAAKDRLNAEEKRAAHEAAGRDYSAAEKAAANAEKKAGMKSSGAAGKAAATPAGVRAMVSGAGIAGLWAANSKAGKGIMDKATALLSKGGSAGAKAASVARFVPGLGMAASGIFALTEFRDGDYVSGALSLVGALPPPVGWVGLGSSLAWNTFFDDTGEIDMWAPPDGANTFILPGSANEVEGVTDADAQLKSAQSSVFAFASGPSAKVWQEKPPLPIRLDTEQVTKAASVWLGEVSQAYSDIIAELERSSEPYAIEYGGRLQPHSSAMAALAEVPTALGTQLTGASDAAATAYSAVLEANRNLRVQLSEGGSLSDRGSLDAADRALQSADTAVDRATGAISGLVRAEVAPALVPAGSVGAPAPAPAPSPLPGVPAPGPGAAPLTPGGAPKSDEKDSVAELLKTLGKDNAMPQMPSVPQLGNPLGGMGGGSPLGGGNPMGNGQGRKLDGGEGRKLDEKSDRKLDDKERKPLEEKADRKLSTAGGPANSTAATPTPAGAPAGTPAVKPEPAAAKPGGPTKPNTEVDVKGEKTDFKDPKLAKMAQLLAAASPQQPMSLSDAAAASGLTPPVPGQDPGRQVQPVDAKPGDILVADGKQFMLLGEGRFYDLQDFKTVGASELPQVAGSRGGYFSLNDPGDPSGGGAPVSPPAGGVPHDVPGGQPPAPTVDASPTGAAPAGGTGAVPSTGAPGVPAAGTGGGPGGTAGTATGSGIPEPSSRTTSLDPAAVR